MLIVKLMLVVVTGVENWFINVLYFNPVPPGKDTFYQLDSISCDKALGTGLSRLLPSLLY